YLIPSSSTKLATAIRPTTAAAIARPTSKPLTFFSVMTLAFAAVAGGAPAAGRAVVAAAAAAAAAVVLAVAGAPIREGGGGGAPTGRDVADGGTPATGRATLAGGAPGGGGTVVGREPAAGAAAPVAGGGGPPAGKVGNLIVAVGFGGKLMRTVCFFEGSGAGAAGGTLGGLSAIYLNCFAQASFDPFGCQTLNPAQKPRGELLPSQSFRMSFRNLLTIWHSDTHTMFIMLINREICPYALLSQ
ncbi:MAG: hypothetical protein JWM16_2018, partial [Verrucomicrobiales bacterium]|nr:hypothetical protein [Verrucomicrobiales bacterium]